MARYIYKLRRGWKDADRNDWAAYEEKDTHVKPYAGELVLEYDNGVPRLKIGDGEHEFSELSYMSVDSFILPNPNSVTLYADIWEQESDGERWSQPVEIVGGYEITPRSKVDLVPDSEQLVCFHNKGLVFVAENTDGNVRVYCVGETPDETYQVPVIITEMANSPCIENCGTTKVIGHVTAAPTSRPDWNQDNPIKGDYIKNKPTGAGENLGFVRTGGDVTIHDGIITINDDSHNHTISNVDGLQSVLDEKQPIGNYVEQSDINALDARIDSVEDAIYVINGSGEGSIANAIAEIVAGADASFDTLKEIADWIMNDTTGAAGMANDIATLESLVGSTNVATSISSAITAALKVDGVDKYALSTRVETIEDAVHTHNNKSEIDLFVTGDKTKLNDSYAHSQVSHAPANAERNTIVGIKVNDAVATIDGNRNVNISIPTKVSEFENDSEFVTADQLPDGITGSDTTPKMDGTASTGVETFFARGDHVHPHDTSKVDKISGKGLSTNDLTNTLKSQYDVAYTHSQSTHITKTSELTNDAGFITEADIPDGAAASQTTPKMNGTATIGAETTFARGDHVHPSDTNKVDKVTGKGLSSNDLTSALKSNYDTAYTHSQSAHAPSNAQQNVQSDWNATSGDAFIKNKPTSMPASDVSTWAKAANKPTYTANEVGAISTSAKGVANGVATLGSDGKVLSSQLPNIVTDIYHIGTTAPTNTKLLWINTTANTGGLKYYNGSSWVSVPVSYQ